VLAEQQPDFIVLARLQRSGQSARVLVVHSGRLRQTLLHGFNDLRMPAIERKAQKVLSVRSGFSG
jgi:hypothetical protein